MDPVPWREAWHEALYAAGRGFYVAAGGPAAHFTTATHGPSGRVLAEALLGLWLRDHDRLPAVVVDMGAGRGEFAAHLRAALDDPRLAAPAPQPSAPAPHPSAPNAAFGGNGKGEVEGEGEVEGQGEREGQGEAAGSGTVVVAVDVVERPDGLDERIEWLRSPGGAALPHELADLEDVLVIAHEWLDVVPCDVAEVDGRGALRYVLVDPETGAEAPGASLSPADLEWVRRYWPTEAPGERVEIGLTRDQAWRDLVARVQSGLLVAVDYGHTRAGRPRGGSLTAYAAGHQTEPVPDGSCDITAHVAMDSLAHDELRSQREVLRDLGVLGRTPPITQASADPLGYVRALERAGAEAQLIEPHGFGAFWWAVLHVPAPSPTTTPALRG